MADGKRAPAGSVGPLTPGLLALTITAIPFVAKPVRPPQAATAGIVNANITARRGNVRHASWTQ